MPVVWVFDEGELEKLGGLYCDGDGDDGTSWLSAFATVAALAESWIEKGLRMKEALRILKGKGDGEDRKVCDLGV